MMSQYFQAGQRVRLRSLAYSIPKGSIGTIVRLYRPFLSLYEVQFDNDKRTRLIFSFHLEALNT